MTLMKSDNVILLGSSRANPWEDLIDSQLNFHFDFDEKLREAYFENRNPLSGEWKFYRGAPNLSYCRIAFVPNLAGTGSVRSIAGTETEGTEGGGEFVTSESQVAKLLALAGRAMGVTYPILKPC